MSETKKRLDEMDKKLDEFVENVNAGVPKEIREQIDAAIKAGDYEEVER